MSDEQIKHVVVTGVSRGLGRALCSALTEHGYRVSGLARKTSDLNRLTAEINSDAFQGYCVDLLDLASIEGVFNKIARDRGGIDVLFNNAALYPKVNFLEESPEAWAQAIQVNLSAVAACCKAVLPSMIQQGFGRIYNVSSWADIAPAVNSSAYSASKGGVHALTKSIGIDIAHLNLDIEVHEWMPGHLNTRMSDFTGFDPAISASWGVAMMTKPASSRCSIFENDHEWFPPKPLKRKLLDALMFWRLLRNRS